MKSAAFLRSFSWLVLLNILIKPVWIFGIDRQLQVLVGHQAYGGYFSIFNLSIILSFLADVGITNMMNRQLALQEPVAIRQLFRFKLALAVLYALILLVVCWVSKIDQWTVVVLVCLIQVFNSFLLFFRNIVTGNQLFTVDAWLSVLDKLIVIVVVGPMLYTALSPAPIQLTSFLSLQAVCTFIAMLIAFLLSRKYFPATAPFVVTWKEVIRLTLPFSVLVLVMSFHTRFDVFLLERVHPNGAFEAGVYATAYRLLDACNTAGYLAGSFLVPYFSRYLGQKDIIEEVVSRFRHLLLLPSIALVAFVAIYAGWVQYTLYSIDDRYHAQVLLLSMGVLPAYYLIHIYGSLLTAAGQFKPFIVLVLVSVFVNLLINAFLIGKLGALACTIAALVSQYLCALACMAYASNKLGVALKLSDFLVYGITGAGLFFLFYFSNQYQYNTVAVGSIGAFLAAMIMFVQVKLKKKVFISF